MFVIALFANLGVGDLDKILLVSINDWHSTFRES